MFCIIYPVIYIYLYWTFVQVNIQQFGFLQKWLLQIMNGKFLVIAAYIGNFGSFDIGWIVSIWCHVTVVGFACSWWILVNLVFNEGLSFFFIAHPLPSLDLWDNKLSYFLLMLRKDLHNFCISLRSLLYFLKSHPQRTGWGAQPFYRFSQSIVLVLVNSFLHEIIMATGVASAYPFNCSIMNSVIKKRNVYKFMVNIQLNAELD